MRHDRLSFSRVSAACAVVPLVLALAGCGTASFDAATYQSAVQLKYETMSLLDNSTSRYPSFKKDADGLLQKYAAAADASAQVPGNDAITEIWVAIKDPRGGSAATVIELWKKAPLRPGARAERKRLVAQHFDRLICLESAKQSAKDCFDVGSAPVPVGEASAAQPRRRPSGAPKPAETEDADEPPKQ